MKRLLLISLVLAMLAPALSCVQQGVPTAQYAQATADLEAAQAQIKTQQADLDKAQAQVITTQADLAAAQAQIKTQQANIDALQSQINTLQASVNATQSQVSTLQTDLDAARSQIQVLQGNTTQNYQIMTLQSQVEAVNNKLKLINLKVTLANDVWLTVIGSLALDTTLVDSWRSLVESIGDAGVTTRYNTLYSQLNNASALELVTYLLNSIAADSSQS